MQLRRRASGIAGSSKQQNASWTSGMGTRRLLSRKRRASHKGGQSAPKGIGMGGGNSRRESAVDESRKEMANRVAR